MVGNGRSGICRRFFGHLTLIKWGFSHTATGPLRGSFLFCPGPHLRSPEGEGLPIHTRPCPSPTLRIGLSVSVIQYRYRNRLILEWIVHPRVWGSRRPWRSAGNNLHFRKAHFY